MYLRLISGRNICSDVYLKRDRWNENRVKFILNFAFIAEIDRYLMLHLRWRVDWNAEPTWETRVLWLLRGVWLRSVSCSASMRLSQTKSAIAKQASVHCWSDAHAIGSSYRESCSYFWEEGKLKWMDLFQTAIAIVKLKGWIDEWIGMLVDITAN